MKTIFYPSDERGGGDYGWLRTRYSFSFNDWFDATKMGFGKLRVLNDDVIAEGQGFGTHGHKNMEIITIVMRGAVRHEDSLGNKYVIEEGDVQVMSAGTGVMHSEHNNSAHVLLELFQIWIEPRALSCTPSYNQKNISFSSVTNEIIELIGTHSLLINQDACIAYGSLQSGVTASYGIHTKGNGVYIFIIEGEMSIGTQVLDTRDALGIWDINMVDVTANTSVQFLIIEVPM